MIIKILIIIAIIILISMYFLESVVGYTYDEEDD